MVTNMIRETIREMRRYVDLQPLQYLAAVRVAISVSESEDLQYMIGRFCKTSGYDNTVGFSSSQWNFLLGEVKNRLKIIGVPVLIIDIVLENLWPISFEIYKWIRYHVEDTGIDRSSNFCWTPHANIDYAETAKILTQSEEIDHKKRFKLACIYCLDTEVRFLWDQMSLSERRSFFLRGNLKNSDQNPIIFYWTYYIQEMPIDYWGSKVLKRSYLLRYAVKNGYFSATKYFFGTFRSHLRIIHSIISDIFPFHFLNLDFSKCIAKDHSAISCYLICRIRWDYEGIDYFSMLSFVFRYFLEWPRQKRFMTVVNRLRRHLTKRIFGDLLEGILAKETGDFKDHDYKELFMELWRQSPLNYKTYVNTESKVGCNILIKFIEKHFMFVFDISSPTMRRKLRTVVFQRETSETETWFEKANVEFLKFLVRERVATKSSVERNRYFFPTQENLTSFLSNPLGELLYLMDGILRNV